MKVSALGHHSRTDIENSRGNHKWVLDEPITAGGTDSGPTPLEALLGSLAGCEVATAHWVAKKIDFALEGLSYKIEGTYDPTAFRQRAPLSLQVPPTHFQEVVLEIHVNTKESDERIQELGRYVEAFCPVASLFHHANVKITSKWTRMSVTQ